VYEPNNSLAAAYQFPVAITAMATDANFSPIPDEDWYGFYVKTGRHYQAYTGNLSDVDTYLELYDQNEDRVGSDDDSGGGFASRIRWTSSYQGYYYIHVSNLVTTIGIYDLMVEQLITYPIYLPLVLRNCFRSAQ
jgi:hypothetical protein